MPEKFLVPYSRMLPRLEAEQTQRLIEALVYAQQRGMDNSEGRQYVRRLEEQAAGHQRPQAIPKVTLDFARQLGAEVRGDGGEEVK